MRHLHRYLGLLVLITALLCPLTARSAVDREQELRSAVTDFVTARTAGLGWQVRVRRMTIGDPLKMPAGRIEYEVVAPQQWEGWGTVNMAVMARQKDRLVRNIPVRLDVEALTDMVVTVRQIEYGAMISADDLALQRREIAYASQRSAHSIAEVVGKKARTTLRANHVVRMDQLEKLPLIKSGQLVTIVAENAVLRITVAGKARSSGAEGDMITVQNQNSLKEIPARIINATTVQVAF